MLLRLRGIRRHNVIEPIALLRTLPLLLVSSETLDKLLHISEPQVAHLYNGGNDSIFLRNTILPSPS